MYTFWRAVSLFCKGLVSLKSCVEQLQFPHEKGSSSHSECLVQLFCLISCWFIFCWYILLHTRSCVFVYKYVLYELMLPIGHVPTQIYVNKTYIPHYNFAIIYIYFLEYIFSYIFFTFGKVLMALLSTVLENYQVFKRKTSPFWWKHINLHRTIIFLITSDVLDRKLNKENQIFIFSSFFNEKGILIEIWYSMNFCVKNVFFLPLTLISEKLHHIFFWRPNYFESTHIAESNDIWNTLPSRMIYDTAV